MLWRWKEQLAEPTERPVPAIYSDPGNDQGFRGGDKTKVNRCLSIAPPTSSQPKCDATDHGIWIWVLSTECWAARLLPQPKIPALTIVGIDCAV